MKRWLKQPAALIFLAITLTLAGVLAGHAVRAQGQAPATGEREAEGSEGSTGAIRGLTREQVSGLQAEGLSAVYHFAGVLNDTTSAVQKATVVQCSNIDESEATEIEVQLFTYDATDVYTGTVDVDPLETATFESNTVPFYAADVVMSTGFVEQGYGRILAEHDNLVCTVHTLDPENSPPTWSFHVPVYRRASGGVLLPALLKNSAR